DAWSRAYLGFVEPEVFRQGTSIELAAAEMQKSAVKVAKIPISDYEYYLLENRQTDIDGRSNGILADIATSVILGPCDSETKQLTPEYDLLLPGSGILIWHVDERVATMDFNGNGFSNFAENMLQVNPNYRFVELMEADGRIGFGGDFYTGFGSQSDMYYSGNNRSFTPTSNPPSIGYNGVNSHIYITNISARDTVMTFDVRYGLLSAGFPRRAGYPQYGLSPVAADLDNDDSTEIIAVSDKNILVMREDGSDFTPLGPVCYDTAYSLIDSLKERQGYALPLFAHTQYTITAGPVVGHFATDTTTTKKYLAVGASDGATGWVYIYRIDSIEDANADGLADSACAPISFMAPVVFLIFDGSLIVAANDTIHEAKGIRLYNIIDGGQQFWASPEILQKELFGITKINNRYLILAGDSNNVQLYIVASWTTADTFDLEGYFPYGPVATDVDRNGLPDVVVASPDGIIKIITVDTTTARPTFQIYGQTRLDDSIFTNPILADIDGDGYADIIIGGRNKIYGLDRHFVSLTDYPLTIDRSFPGNKLVAAPIAADINNDRRPDIIAGTTSGNCYAMGSMLLNGFPVSAGAGGVGSALVYRKSDGGAGLALLGADGWFYSYDVAYDSLYANWPMGGYDEHG
ncbi:MAG: VCBS repeat-containing protein, partial [candidate division Zixibacteria bacterium]|nr:VCBS repeat-containing protein [candidate division Zixibacteria bacterium]